MQQQSYSDTHQYAAVTPYIILLCIAPLFEGGIILNVGSNFQVYSRVNSYLPWILNTLAEDKNETAPVL